MRPFIGWLKRRLFLRMPELLQTRIQKKSSSEKRGSGAPILIPVNEIGKSPEAFMALVAKLNTKRAEWVEYLNRVPRLSEDGSPTRRVVFVGYVDYLGSWIIVKVNRKENRAKFIGFLENGETEIPGYQLGNQRGKPLNAVYQLGPRGELYPSKSKEPEICAHNTPFPSWGYTSELLEAVNRPLPAPATGSPLYEKSIETSREPSFDVTAILERLGTPTQELGPLGYDFGQGIIPVYLLGIDVTREPRPGIIVVMKDCHLLDRMRPKAKKMIQLYQLQGGSKLKNSIHSVTPA